MKASLLAISLLVLATPVFAQRSQNAPTDLAARIAILEQQVAALQPTPQVAGSRYHINTLFTQIYATGPHPVQSVMIAATALEMSFHDNGTGLAVQTDCTATRLTDPEYNVNGNPVPSSISSDTGLCWPTDRPFEYVQVGNTVLVIYDQNGLEMELTVSDDGSSISHGLANSTFGSPSGPNNQTLNTGHALIWTGVRLSD